VYGVPETYIIDAEGRIRFKQVGPIFPEILEETILPLIRELQG
jgi:cytochrome c biogenesis protein CcmG/thiol:disulfide interchange protein DsbE